MARIAHPDVGEDRGADRGADDHDGGDDGCPLLVLEVDGDRSPARHPDKPGGGRPVRTSELINAQTAMPTRNCSRFRITKAAPLTTRMPIGVMMPMATSSRRLLR